MIINYLNRFKKCSLSVVFFIKFSVFVHSQTTLISQPEGTLGKDAILHGAPNYVYVNYGNNPQFVATDWTFSGVPGTVRSVIEFDLTSIPMNAIITHAELSLYAWDDTGGMGQHSTLSGSNECWLERVTSDWDESTVTWNTQPSTTEINRVNIPASTSATEDYINLDVAILVQDMVNNPDISFGFMLKLKEENYYRRLNFCSSDHLNSKLHPRLLVTYTISVGIDEQMESANFIQVYPNPVQDLVTINVNSVGSSFTISDQLGRIVLDGILTNVCSIVNLQELSSGVYLLTVEGQNQQSLRFIKN